MKKIWCYVDTETECDELCTIIDDWFKFRELKKRAGLDGYGYYYCNDEDMTKIYDGFKFVNFKDSS